MSQSAPQAKYRAEAIAGFEKGMSVLSKTVTTEANIEGASATFLVADTGGAVATQRGLNGKIPGRAENLNQYTATLQEYHDKPQRTRFNLYTSQGDGRRIMQEGTRKVMNRTMDNIIRAELSTTANVVDSGTASTFSMTIAQTLNTILGNANVDGDIFAAITPAVYGYMIGLDQFTSRDYIDDPKFKGVGLNKAFNWYGINWVVDTAAEGVGTSSAKCFVYSKNAIGCAVDSQNMQVLSGYNEEDDFSWARSSLFMGAKLLQGSGVWQFNHNDSALSS